MLAAAMMLATASVAAQTDPLDSTPPPAEHPTFALAPEIALTDAGIDTNILATSQNPRRDTTGRLTFRADPWSRLGRVDLRGRTAVGLVYYRQYSDLRSVDADEMGRIDVRLNRVTLFGSGSLLRSSDVFGPEIDTRTRRTELGGQGGAEIRVSKRTSVTAYARRGSIEFDPTQVLFDANLRSVLNRVTTGMALRARHRLTPLTAVVARGEVGTDRFQFSPDRDTRSVGVLAGFEMNPSAMIEGTALVGYTQFRPATSSIPSLGTVAATVDVAYTAVEALRLAVHVRRDLGNSFSLLRRYYVVTDVQGSITQRLTPRFDLTGSVGRQLLSYPDPSAPDNGDPTLPLDRALRFGVGVIVRMGRTSIISVTGESYRRDAALTGSTYDRMRLVSAIRVRF